MTAFCVHVSCLVCEGPVVVVQRDEIGDGLQTRTILDCLNELCAASMLRTDKLEIVRPSRADLEIRRREAAAASAMGDTGIEFGPGKSKVGAL
jgi:hypothetical protein